MAVASACTRRSNKVRRSGMTECLQTQVVSGLGRAWAQLSPGWWGALIQNWNLYPGRHVLAGLGRVQFVVLGEPSLSVWICWDESGNAQECAGGSANDPCFSATAENWRAFMARRFTATAGVIQGRLRFEGTVRKVLPYSQAFNE